MHIIDGHYTNSLCDDDRDDQDYDDHDDEEDDDDE